jgi:hypothetical protein
MVKVVNDDLWVCQDCLLYIANGDLTGLDNNPETAERRQAEILAGIERELPAQWVADSSEETDREFSSAPCDCCEQRAAGSRYHCVLLG